MTSLEDCSRVLPDLAFHSPRGAGPALGMLRAGGFEPPVTSLWIMLGYAQNCPQSIWHATLTKPSVATRRDWKEAPRISGFQQPQSCTVTGYLGPRISNATKPRPLGQTPQSKMETRETRLCIRDGCITLLEVPAAVGQGIVLEGEDAGGYVTKGIECLRSCQASEQARSPTTTWPGAPS